jgi:serine/threonine-protein kinase
MPGESHVELLLEAILESDCTPEEACRDCPELLPRVKARLRQIRAVDAKFDALFPSPGSGPAPPVSAEAGPPHFPGFEVRGLLGRGGLAIVYRAWDLRLRRDVAIKTLIAGAYARPEELERFLRGAEAKAGLRHANIVKVYDVGDLNGCPYFTMEFVEGGSLAQRLAGAPLPPDKAVELLAALADAVQAAHDGGVVHRDLKPANVLLTAEGTPKVADFGLAHRMDGGAGLTHSGAVLGTPSYMAPEQAQGKSSTVGPAADVYALGAILYETLTGRPPFRGETREETIRQVIEFDPVPPSRLNTRVPRDLETICLKCLSKEQQARYPSAAALADDLRRFQRGEAITARAPGPAERLARWLRRRRPQAAVVAVGALLAAGAVGGGLRLWSEGRAIEQGVEDDLREAARWQQAADWSGAAIALERARGRLSRGGPAGLRRRLDEAGRGLDQARRERILVAQLEAIRLVRMTLVEGRFNPRTERLFNDARADRAYEAAFLAARVGTPGDDPAGLGVLVAAMAVRAPVVAALDDWAACAADGRRRAWVLSVARRADPDAWRDRARDPAAWEDPAALAGLARTAPVADQPLSLLVALGERWMAVGGDGTGFLSRVRQAAPADFWTNLALGKALQEKRDVTAAADCYLQALKARNDSATAYNNLGVALYLRYDLPAAIERFQQALRIDPRFAPAYNNLGRALSARGSLLEAVAQYREALEFDPGLASAHANLGEALSANGEMDDAIGHCREALRIDPEFARAHYYVGFALAGRGRLDEAYDRRRAALRIDPEAARAHDIIFGVAVGEGFEYLEQLRQIDPKFTVSHNNLGLTPRDAGRLNEAIDHFERALRIDPGADPWFDAPVHAALGQALLALDRFDEAEAATRRCLDGLPREDGRRSNIKIQLRRCQRLLALRDRLPAALQGKDRPRDAAETLELAELCGMQGRFAAAARLYVEAFAASPPSADDPCSPHRYTAACAAALAGRGRGEDGATLGEADRARWRGRAREWLRADLTVWARTLESGAEADLLLVLRRLAHLWADPDLAGLFDHDALDSLPPAERQECRTLWAEVDALIRRAQALKVARG